MNYDVSEKEYAQKLDHQANEFALALLMPRDQFLDEIKKLGGLDLTDDTNLKLLCKTFGVTATAVAYRLRMLKDK